MHEDLDFLKYLTPFKYFDAALLLHESRLDMTFVYLSVAIIVLSMTGAYVTYARRDLYI
jgi:ABC-2 type transport system permease protein